MAEPELRIGQVSADHCDVFVGTRILPHVHISWILVVDVNSAPSLSRKLLMIATEARRSLLYNVSHPSDEICSYCAYTSCGSVTVYFRVGTGTTLADVSELERALRLYICAIKGVKPSE